MAGPGRRGGAALAGPDAADLGPDQSPVRDKVVDQCRRGPVAGVFAVPAHEPPGKVCGSELLQVHYQERRVVKAVHPAQAVVEVQAVQHPGPVVQTEDVVRQQVAVTIDNAPLRSSACPTAVTAREELLGQASELVDSSFIEERPARPGSVEIVLPAVPGDISAALLADRGPAALSRRVLSREYPGHLTDGPCYGLAGLDERSQAAAGGHPAHQDQVVAGLAGLVPYRRDPKIDIRRKPAVEFRLPGAGFRPRLHRAEVQKAEPTGFFSLQARFPAKYTTAECVSDAPQKARPAPRQREAIRFSHIIITPPSVRGRPGPQQGCRPQSGRTSAPRLTGGNRLGRSSSARAA